MPITQYVYAPQHPLGLAVVGLIFYLTIARPLRGLPQAVALALLLVALFRTSTFVFVGAVPGLALWHLFELLTGKERIRQLANLATTALVALALALPYLIDILSKRSYLEFGLRSFVFLNIPGIPWLRYPITGFVFLLLEIGIPVPAAPVVAATTPPLYAAAPLLALRNCRFSDSLYRPDASLQ